MLRELGLVAIFWDVSFSAVQSVFDETGRLRDQAYLPRIDKFLKELSALAATDGRNQDSSAGPVAPPGKAYGVTRRTE